MILDVSEICSKIDLDLAKFIHNIILLIKIAVPIALVIFGMIDLGKGVIASKEDEIKKGQKDFIKRIIAGVIVFFIVSITQLVMSVIDRNSNGEFWTCANGIMNGTSGWNKILNDSLYYVDEEEKNKTNEMRSCHSTFAQSEYEKCLSYQSQKMCDTIFQDECVIPSSNRLWITDKTKKEVIESFLTGPTGTNIAIDCSSSDDELELIYLRSFYSCKFKTGNMNTESCLRYIYPFCKAKNVTDTKKSDCCYQAGGIMNNSGNCIDYDDYTTVKENNGKPIKKTVDIDKFNSCMGN